MPGLLLPAGLLALAALALPLLLHLARREDQRPVDFAALRWLSARVRPRRRLRFEERLLLALRLLLVALLALLLARPVLPLEGRDAAWIVAAPGVAAEALRDARHVGDGAAATAEAGRDIDVDGDGDGDGDTDGRNDGTTVQRRWLAPGFPALGDAPAPAHGPATISLLRELDMRMPTVTPLVVLVPPVLDGVDAERPRLSRPVQWRVVPAGDDRAAGDIVGGTADDADSNSSARTPTPTPTPTPTIIIRDAGNGTGARYLRAVSAAWQEPRDGARHDDAGDHSGHGSSDHARDTGDAMVGEPGEVRAARASTGLEVHAWLAAGELPAEAMAWIEAGGTALLAHDVRLAALDGAPTLWHDDQGRPLLRGTALGSGHVLQWTRALEPEAMPVLLEADFPHRLRAALQPPPPPARVLAAEHAPLTGNVGPWPQGLRELSPWLALAIALLCLLERWLASGTRRERQP
ncbi:BatA domain-containing protein [Luteimonas colneyensis]|nr:BatA domain-containing protein [Luteimonas colneyensis]